MILIGDVFARLREIESDSINCCVTSPPYCGLRDYGVAGQIGLEASPHEFVSKMVEVFREVRRVLRPDGTLWLNLGDSYASRGGAGWQGKHSARANRTHTQPRLLGNTTGFGIKAKDLVGIPWRVTLALQEDGWYLRQDIIWHKPNPMPESVRDRCTKAHEYIFLLSKSPKYYFDQESIKEPCSPNTHARVARGGAGSKRAYGGACGKRPMRAVLAGINTKAAINFPGSKQNSSFAAATLGFVDRRIKRSVWCVGSKPFKAAHFATFPPKLIEPCILAGCPEGGIVLDPFFGAGTAGLVALQHGRRFIGIELNPEYAKIAERRLAGIQQELGLDGFR